MLDRKEKINILIDLLQILSLHSMSIQFNKERELVVKELMKELNIEDEKTS